MTIFKKILIGIGVLIILLVIISGIYLLIHVQDPAESMEVGSPDLSKKILIATQGSKYKNLMLDTLVARLKAGDVYINVIDISNLNEIKQGDWDAEVIIHTTEGWKLPDPVKEYLNRMENPDEVILLITSGDGNWKPEECKVDVLTSASKVADISEKANSIEEKINLLLEVERVEKEE
jgi:hypothetical protein